MRQIVEHNWEKLYDDQGGGRVVVWCECVACGALVSFLQDHRPDEKNLKLARKQLRISTDCHKAAVKHVMQK